uniref:Uncharacterized protein n=1 Tax=Medicago truncatula TaxID=3880 RepID=I3RZT4_MEDTR|nr:unknown [Medicago truncatula]
MLKKQGNEQSSLHLLTLLVKGCPQQMQQNMRRKKVKRPRNWLLVKPSGLLAPSSLLDGTFSKLFIMVVQSQKGSLEVLALCLVHTGEGSLGSKALAELAILLEVTWAVGLVAE